MKVKRGMKPGKLKPLNFNIGLFAAGSTGKNYKKLNLFVDESAKGVTLPWKC
jgi:hypothetical protein